MNSGGLRTVVKELNFHLNLYEEINSFILSTDREEEDRIFLVRLAKRNPWLYSRHWISKLERVVKLNNINIIHIHGVWMYPQYMSAKFAIKQSIPFILTPHGMYEPWLWTKGRLKKKI